MKKLLSIIICLCMLFILIIVPSTNIFLTKADTIEYAMFPGNVLKVTQGAYGEYNSYSHNGQGGYYQNAFDLSGNTNYFAPFSGTITKIKTSYNAIVLQSDSKIYWANGDYDYMSVTFVHDNDISDLYVGKHVEQGEIFYQPGVKDPGGYTTGTHLHICVNKGLTDEGIRIFSGDVRPNDAFFLNSNVSIAQNGNYTWKNLVSNPWIKASKSGLFLGESVTFDFGADNATSYKITIKHLDEIVKTEDDVKSGISYTFYQEGTYYAYITAKNGATTVDSKMVSFYIVDALDMGCHFISKIRNPVSCYYIALDTSNNNVYLASEITSYNNEWRFLRQDDLSYKILNIKTGECLGLSDLSVENGTNIGCYPDDNTDYQRWYIRKNLSGYALVSKANFASDLSITGNGWIYGDCIFDGANISLYENDSVQSQRFELVDYCLLYGDTDADGKVDTTDLATLKLFLAGSGDLSDIGKSFADLDGDGKIGTSDLAVLKLYLAGATNI